MLIAALAVNDGSENALLCHVGNHHLVTAVDAFSISITGTWVRS